MDSDQLMRPFVACLATIHMPGQIHHSQNTSSTWSSVLWKFAQILFRSHEGPSPGKIKWVNLLHLVQSMGSVGALSSASTMFTAVMTPHSGNSFNTGGFQTVSPGCTANSRNIRMEVEREASGGGEEVNSDAETEVDSGGSVKNDGSGVDASPNWSGSKQL
ncbi:hypothetical protein HDK77DRAFT_487903 [Phyllosticta capitalensis]